MLINEGRLQAASDTQGSVATSRTTLDSKDRLLTKHELARFLGVTSRTVEEYQRRGLSFFRISARRNRYDLVAVRAWLNRQCLVVRLR